MIQISCGPQSLPLSAQGLHLMFRRPPSLETYGLAGGKVYWALLSTSRIDRLLFNRVSCGTD